MEPDSSCKKSARGAASALNPPWPVRACATGGSSPTRACGRGSCATGWSSRIPRPRTASATDPDKLQLLIPDGHSEIVFRFAGSFTRWSIDTPDKRAQMAASYVIGGRSKSVFTRSTGGLRLAGVKLDPRALRALIGMPLSELQGHHGSVRGSRGDGAFGTRGEVGESARRSISSRACSISSSCEE